MSPILSETIFTLASRNFENDMFHSPDSTTNLDKLQFRFQVIYGEKLGIYLSKIAVQWSFISYDFKISSYSWCWSFGVVTAVNIWIC